MNKTKFRCIQMFHTLQYNLYASSTVIYQRQIFFLALVIFDLDNLSSINNITVICFVSYKICCTYLFCLFQGKVDDRVIIW